MSHAATFFAAGVPVGQPRPRAVIRRSKSGQMHAGVFDAGTADNWKDCVRLAARQAGLAHANLSGPLAVTLRFHFPRPAGHHKAGDKSRELKPTAPIWHTVKPDADNGAKAVLDALTDCGVWLDDSQVCDLHPVKLYATGRVGCEITVTPIAK